MHVRQAGNGRPPVERPPRRYRTYPRSRDHLPRSRGARHPARDP